MDYTGVRCSSGSQVLAGGVVAGGCRGVGEVLGAQGAYLGGVGACGGDAQGLGGDGLFEQVPDVPGVAEVPVPGRGGSISRTAPLLSRRWQQRGLQQGQSPHWRRVWDLNPRGHSRALAVFKTAAIGH
jgi:hypothetical protein